MRYFEISIRFLPAVLLAVTLVGCDSGGGGDDVSLGDTATLKVEGPSEATFSWNFSFAYNEEDGFCLATGRDASGRAQPPFEQTFTPEKLAGSGCPPAGTDTTNFQGVLANVGVPEGTSGLTVRLLSGGEEVDASSDPGENGFLRVQAGDVPDVKVPELSGFSE